MKFIMFDNVLIEDVIVSQFHVPDPQKNVTNIGDKYPNTGNILKPETNRVVNTQTDDHVMY